MGDLNMPNLKRCPFCGGEAQFARGFDYGEIGAIRWVCCTRCGAMTRSDLHKTEADAAKAWNTRIEPFDYIECYECQNGAPMVPLRTCRNISSYWFFECSECGASIVADSCGEFSPDVWVENGKLNYCPNCGAKVLSEEEQGHMIADAIRRLEKVVNK